MAANIQANINHANTATDARHVTSTFTTVLDTAVTSSFLLSYTISPLSNSYIATSELDACTAADSGLLEWRSTSTSANSN